MSLSSIYFLISGTTLAVLHTIAVLLHLYWKIEWFDTPMHVLGGVVVGLLWFTLQDIGPLSKMHRFALVGYMVFVGAILLGWELFELLIGSPLSDVFIVDTGVDILAGILGAGISWFVVKALDNIETAKYE